jgi:hypothetical protein
MKGLRVVLVVLTMFLAFGVASVYASNGTGEAQVGVPILGTTGAPALAAPSLFSGAISVLYADGTPVVLQTNQVTLNVCNTSCVTITATLKQTAPGAYTYSFTPPTSLTGTVTIYVKAYGLADDNGRIFPSVDTQIGTYAYSPSTSSTSQQPGTNVPPAGTPVAPLTGQAVNTLQTPTQTPTQTFPIGELLAVLSVFALAGCLLILPSRL